MQYFRILSLFILLFAMIHFHRHPVPEHTLLFLFFYLLKFLLLKGLSKSSILSIYNIELEKLIDSGVIIILENSRPIDSS